MFWFPFIYYVLCQHLYLLFTEKSLDISKVKNKMGSGTILILIISFGKFLVTCSFKYCEVIFLVETLVVLNHFLTHLGKIKSRSNLKIISCRILVRLVNALGTPLLSFLINNLEKLHKVSRLGHSRIGLSFHLT